MLTSLDWARLVQLASYNYCNVVLGKTQINKILYYVYGVYYAMHGERMFEGDELQAWTYGPVFPTVYRKIVVGDLPMFGDSKKQEFTNHPAFGILCAACKTMPYKSAIELTEWSHQEGSPWYKAIYASENYEATKKPKWGTPISDEDLQEYFSKNENLVYGR